MRPKLFVLVVLGVWGINCVANTSVIAHWTFDPEQQQEWSCSGLWKFVSTGDLSKEPSSVRTFPSPPYAAYFGEIRGGRGSYETGGRVTGEMESPWIRVSATALLQPGDQIQVKFRYLRYVESFQGNYDQTVVYLYIRDVSGRYWNDVGKRWQWERYGKTLFSKSSADPSLMTWQLFTSDKVEIPDGAAYVSVGFFFDSVDHLDNGYLGWLVDNVEFVRFPAQLRITTTSLRPGIQGEWYSDRLVAAGGIPPFTWSVAPSSQLPEGLTLNRSTGELSGRPARGGTFQIKFVVEDAVGAKAEKTLTLEIFETGGQRVIIYWWWFGFGLYKWENTGLWHYADYWEETGGAYYAIPHQNSYDTGSRTSGYLRSPEISVQNFSGKSGLIRFTFRREVEYTPSGAYDRTFVQVRFHNGREWTDWRTVWSEDSRKPSNWDESRDEVGGFQIPADARLLQIQFVFDSVDRLNNGYRGWLIYWVSVFAYSGELTITTQNLPMAEVGVPYSVQLEASGGWPPYTWTATGLPEGLEVERTGRIYGVPKRAGSFQVEVAVEDSTSTKITKRYTLQVSAERVTLFFEDFEEWEDGAQWQLLPPWPSLWKVADEVKAKGQRINIDRVAYFGKDEGWDANYDIGTRATGMLTSKPFSLEDAKYVIVSFDYWREVESYDGDYDLTYVQIRFDGGQWQTIWSKSSKDASERAWTKFQSQGLAVPTGAATMQIRFVFDSVDRYNNRYVGWLIDNVRVQKAQSGTAVRSIQLLEALPQDFQVVVSPNPVRDVHTAVFSVQGVEAEALRVEVYDLAGRLVWKGEALGSELVWHTEDGLGRYLANGVYLYRAFVRVEGTWLVAPSPGKVVILR